MKIFKRFRRNKKEDEEIMEDDANYDLEDASTVHIPSSSPSRSRRKQLEENSNVGIKNKQESLLPKGAKAIAPVNTFDTDKTPKMSSNHRKQIHLDGGEDFSRNDIYNDNPRYDNTNRRNEQPNNQVHDDGDYGLLVDDHGEIPIYIVKQQRGYLSVLFSFAQTVILIAMMIQCKVAPMNINRELRLFVSIFFSYKMCHVQCILYPLLYSNSLYQSSQYQILAMVGPYPDALNYWGGKNAYYILYDQEYWRLVSPIMLHAGVFHLICNVSVQLDTGAFWEREWGSVVWLIVYLVSAIWGSILSVIVIPNSVGVGSSGSVCGLFGAKMVSSWMDGRRWNIHIAVLLFLITCIELNPLTSHLQYSTFLNT